MTFKNLIRMIVRCQRGHWLLAGILLLSGPFLGKAILVSSVLSCLTLFPSAETVSDVTLMPDAERYYFLSVIGIVTVIGYLCSVVSNLAFIHLQLDLLQSRTVGGVRNYFRLSLRSLRAFFFFWLHITPRVLLGYILLILPGIYYSTIGALATIPVITKTHGYDEATGIGREIFRKNLTVVLSWLVVSAVLYFGAGIVSEVVWRTLKTMGMTPDLPVVLNKNGGLLISSLFHLPFDVVFAAVPPALYVEFIRNISWTEKRAINN